MSTLKRVSAVAACLWACQGSPNPASDGGSDANPGSDGGPVLDGLCPMQHTEPFGGGTWVVCDQLYSSAPLIRPPPDTATTFFVGFKATFNNTGYTFDMVSRTQSWPEPMGFSDVIEGTSGSHPPYGYTLYEATITQNTVTALQPVARIDERLFLQPFEGAVLEGDLSPRVVAPDGGVTFDFMNLDVPVRVTLDSDTKPADAGTYGFAFIGATIQNIDGGVTSSTGTCLASLASFGSANPVTGEADPSRLAFMRDPDMHGQHDDVIVMNWSSQSLGNTMDPAGFISVPDLLLSVPLDLSSFGGGFTHGTPSGTPSSTGLVSVTDGGAPCP